MDVLGLQMILCHLQNRASWIRTSECSSQSAVPYRLAIALHKNVTPM